MKDLMKLPAQDLVNHIFNFGEKDNNILLLEMMIKDGKDEDLKKIYQNKLKEIKEGAQAPFLILELHNIHQKILLPLNHFHN